MKLECPACAAILRTAQPLRKGKRVSCARCGHGFLFPGEEELPIEAVPVYKPVILSPSPHYYSSQNAPLPVEPEPEVVGYALADSDDPYDSHFGPDRYMRTPDGFIYGFSMASDPVAVSLSREKLKIVQPELFGVWGGINKLINRCVTSMSLFDQLEMCLTNGDSRAAVVLTIEPLRVAAYTDEFDCVIILRFTKEVDNYYRLEPGDRLLTINTYAPPGSMKRPKDITMGDRYKGSEWENVFPFIADFMTDDMDMIERRKRAISEDEWQRAMQMGRERLRRKPRRARDGRPFFNGPSAQKWDD